MQVSDAGGGMLDVESFFDIFTGVNLNDLGSSNPDNAYSGTYHYASANAPAGPAPSITGSRAWRRLALPAFA